MKHTLIIFCLSIFIFAKCKKDKLEPEGQYYGNAKAEINGSMVSFNTPRGALKSNSYDSIYISLEKWDGLVLKEVISFGPILKTVGLVQRINKNNYSTSGIGPLSSSYSTLRDDGDVLCDFYHIYERDSLHNSIIITSFNAATKEISGSFQATYLIDPTRVKCRTTAPDTMRIKNGEFYTKIF
jgi:hypothetical protein